MFIKIGKHGWWTESSAHVDRHCDTYRRCVRSGAGCRTEVWSRDTDATLATHYGSRLVPDQ